MWGASRCALGLNIGESCVLAKVKAAQIGDQGQVGAQQPNEHIFCIYTYKLHDQGCHSTSLPRSMLSQCGTDSAAMLVLQC